MDDADLPIVSVVALEDEPEEEVPAAEQNAAGTAGLTPEEAAAKAAEAEKSAKGVAMPARTKAVRVNLSDEDLPVVLIR